MTEIKRADDLLEAFASFDAASATPHLLVVGDGPLRAELESGSPTLGIADRVHFIGFRRTSARSTPRCDAVALTSANEGTPVSVIEALAAGRPAVSTDVGGVADVVAGRTDRASSFRRATSTAIADRLRRLAADRGLRERSATSGARASCLATPCRGSSRDIDALYRGCSRTRAAHAG